MFTSSLNKLRAYIWRGIIVFVIYFSLVHMYVGAHILLTTHEGSYDEHHAHYLVDAIFTHQKSGKTVRFIGMRHVADEHFYNVVSDILKENSKAVVYMEGVDVDAFDYTHHQDTREYVVASAVRAIIVGGYDSRAKDTGLSLQTEKLILPRLPEEADVPFAKLVSTCAASFNCTLGALSMGSRESSLRLYFFYPLAALVFRDVLVDTRNEYLMKQVFLKDAPTSILLPWGAEHYDGIRAALLREGYQETARTWRKACDK